MTKFKSIFIFLFGAVSALQAMNPEDRSLLDALKEGDLEKVRCFLDEGTDVNQRIKEHKYDKEGTTSFRKSCFI